MPPEGRIGILTGGGDCPGLNGVIRAVVRSAEHHGWETIGILDGFEGLIRPNRARRLTSEDVRGILGLGGTILGTSNRADPFAYRWRENGQVMVEDRSEACCEQIRSLALDVLVVVGGDGTLRIAHQISQLGTRVIGVPKTIDNDISATDLTFGFDTAVNTASEALDRLHTTAESHHRIMILEVMGRNAGWIALHAGLAGGGDIILIPEIPFSTERVLEEIVERNQAGRSFSMVVVAEGAKPIGGKQLMQESVNPLTPTRLGGIGPWLADTLGRQTELEIRSTVLGHLQRGGSPTAFDRVLATRFGVAAVDAIIAGRSDYMVALQGSEIVDVPLEDAIVHKSVPTDGPLVRAARQIEVSFGD